MDNGENNNETRRPASNTAGGLNILPHANIEDKDCNEDFGMKIEKAFITFMDWL